MMLLFKLQIGLKKNMKISIITATYNSQNTILDTLKCIENQSYQNIEHIIVDGGSKDNTLSIVKEFPHVFKIISEPDEGIYDAMNKGINLSSGDVLGILNSDDIYFNNDTIKDVVSHFVNNDIDLTYGNILITDKFLKKVKRKWISNSFNKGSFKAGWHPPHPSLFVKKSIYNKFGLFNLEYEFAADFDLMLRFFEINQCKVMFINNFITKMRLGGKTTKSLKNIIEGNKEIINIFNQNNLKAVNLYSLKRILKKLLQYFK